jgi:hypothetical protein
MLAAQAAAPAPSAPTGNAVSGRVAQLLGGLDLGASADGDIMADDDISST